MLTRVVRRRLLIASPLAAWAALGLFRTKPERLSSDLLRLDLSLFWDEPTLTEYLIARGSLLPKFGTLDLSHPDAVCLWKIIQHPFLISSSVSLEIDSGDDQLQFTPQLDGTQLALVARASTKYLKFTNKLSTGFQRLTGSWTTPAEKVVFSLSAGDAIDVAVRS